jgi:hypothetical protein
MSDTKSRATRYRELLASSADRHHTTITDTRAVYEAGLILAHEDQTAQMVAGEKIDIATYLRLGEELAKLIPPPEPIKVTVDIVRPAETICPACGCQFDPDTPERMLEKQEAAAIAALPSSDTPPAATGEAKASAPVPARPAPPPPPPPAPPISETMAAWNRHCGYNRSARDGGLIKGAAVPHQDPNLPGMASGRYENYANDKPVTWNGYMDGRRQYGGAQPDINPNFKQRWQSARRAQGAVLMTRKHKFTAEQRARHNAYQRKWRREHREQYRAYYRAYYAKHRAYIRKRYSEWTPEQKVRHNATQRKWRMANLEKVRAYRRAYYAAHPEKIRAKGRAYYAKHRVKVLARYRKRRLEHLEQVRAADRQRWHNKRMGTPKQRAAYNAGRRIKALTPEKRARLRARQKKRTTQPIEKPVVLIGTNGR